VLRNKQQGTSLGLPKIAFRGRAESIPELLTSKELKGEVKRLHETLRQENLLR
jgi:hypothetical protein